MISATTGQMLRASSKQDARACRLRTTICSAPILFSVLTAIHREPDISLGSVHSIVQNKLVYRKRVFKLGAKEPHRDHTARRVGLCLYDVLTLRADQG
jgi:hypothetical protein